MTDRVRTPAPGAVSLLRFILPALIVLLVFACYMPVINNGFVWDDEDNFLHSTNYRGLSPSHIVAVFTTVHWGLYQPVSVLSHALVYAAWNVSPVAFHLVNLALHAANAVFVYFLVLALLSVRAPPPRSPLAYGAATVGALFFALHPLRVEVVAWATERREILCAFFLILALLAYLRMQERRQQGDPRWSRWYMLSLAAFTLSLLSKAQGMTFPVTLVILDAYPLGRLSPRRGINPPARLRPAAVLLEKLPYAVVAMAAAVVALVAQVRDSSPAPLDFHGSIGRLLQAAYGLIFYLEKTAVPVGLSPLYLLHLPLDLTRARYWVSATAVLGITATLVVLRRRHPWALVAWICYVVTVSPMLGLAQMGPQMAADRYTYLSCLPWAVLAAVGVQRLWLAGQREQRHRPVVSAGLALAGVLLVGFGVGTYGQTQVWRDGLTLWSHALAVEPDNYYAYHNRGYERLQRGDLRGAISDFDQVCHPTTPYPSACTGRAEARRRVGDLAGALADYDVVVRLNPHSQVAYAGRGDVLLIRHDLDGALASYRQANHVAPTAMGHSKIAHVLRLRGDKAEAMREWRAATRLEPSNAEAWYQLARLLDELGQLAGALHAYGAFLETSADSRHEQAGLVRRRMSELMSARENP